MRGDVGWVGAGARWCRRWCEDGQILRWVVEGEDEGEEGAEGLQV